MPGPRRAGTGLLSSLASTGQRTTPDVPHPVTLSERCRAKAVGRSSSALGSGRVEGVDQLSEFLGGGPEAERLTGPAVELAGDLVELCLGYPREALAFREVLAKQTVGVLVGPALPGAAGIAEVHLDAGLDVEPPVLCHLLSLVPGQRAAQLDGQRRDARLERLADRLGVGSLR